MFWKEFHFGSIKKKWIQRERRAYIKRAHADHPRPVRPSNWPIAEIGLAGPKEGRASIGIYGSWIMHGPLLKVNPSALRRAAIRIRTRAAPLRASMTAFVGNAAYRSTTPLRSRRNGPVCARVKVKPPRERGKRDALRGRLLFRRCWRTIAVTDNSSFPEG